MRLERLIPDCRVSVEGQRLDLPADAALLRAEVDLDGDLFGQCTLLFIDRGLGLINGDTFQSGSKVKVEMGFGSSLLPLFEGEVVALEPRFMRDKPPALRVCCQEALHRLALSPMTRAFNDADDRQIATAIAQEHGLSADAPQGTPGHALQANLTDAAFLRRRAQQHGQQIHVEGTRLVIAAPGNDDSGVTLRPGDGVKKMKVKVDAGKQVGAVSVHGWDAANKREIVSRVEPEGDAGEGGREHGGDNAVSLAGHEPAPADTRTAESMARGRMRRLAERFVTAEVEMIGDARLTPGKLFTLDKVDEKLDGQYRVEHATHCFDKHGYRLSLKGARVKNKPPPAAPRPPPRPDETLPDPEWSLPDYQHGDRGEVRVRAPGHDGRMVRFSIEVQQGGRWRPFASVAGEVSGGVATAQLDLRHLIAPSSRAHGNHVTSEEARQAQPLSLRCHARLV